MKKIIFPLILLGAYGPSCSDEPSTTDFEPFMATIKSVDYHPAPGQFIGEMPEYEDGDTPADMNRKACEALNQGELVSLGAFGGYVVIELDKPIRHDSRYWGDFRILGNSYSVGSMDGMPYGSAEPGIVWVSADGKTWHMVQGQEAPVTTTVTYTAVENPVAERWMQWRTTDGATGWLTCNTAYHNHSYMPRWIDATDFTVTGMRLPDNGWLDDTNQYRQWAWTGYADSYGNNHPGSALTIPVRDDIRFIKVQTGVLQSNGPLGECSTEVGGIMILHE